MSQSALAQPLLPFARAGLEPVDGVLGTRETAARYVHFDRRDTHAHVV